MPTKEEKDATLAALLEERRGYKVRGLDDRVAEVDRQLAALGGGAQKKSDRSQKRPNSRETSKR